MFACICLMKIILQAMKDECSPGASAKNHLSASVMLKVSAITCVTFSIAKVSRGRASVMANIKIIKEEVSNLKENLESIDSDDVELNRLHQRVYDLKMSLLNVDDEIKRLNFLTERDIRRSQKLLVLKDFYRQELRSLEMVL